MIVVCKLLLNRQSFYSFKEDNTSSMAHFQFEKSVTDLIRMDGPLQNAPLTRWQRKAQETLLRIHPSDNGLSSPARSRPASWTPSKLTKTPGQTKSPGKTCATPGSMKKARTPKVTPGRHLGYKTPSKKLAVTPGKQQDRFIPNRVTTDQEMSHFALLNVREQEEEEELGSSNNNNSSISIKGQYQQQLTEALLPHHAGTDAKILSFKNKLDASMPRSLHVLYTTGKKPVDKSNAGRYIPNKPEHVLDAPDIIDDYYLHTLNWSSTNIVAAALGSEIYLWNANNSSITLLMTAEQEQYVSGLSWITDGSILAVGLSGGSVQLWDVNKVRLVRTMIGHSARVGCLDWNAHILTSGSRSGAIHHHDVRVADHHVASLLSHTQEVCGLKWSPDGRYLASGANDNTINIWDTVLDINVLPLHHFTEHQGAVKAVSWCPWQATLLATGGGTNDRYIRFWNVVTGSCVKAVHTESQVCSVLWSKEYRELISGHGYSMNQLSIWKYPHMTKITDLIGHSARILDLCMSPDGQTVASIAADETIRLWKCFAVDKNEKKPKVVAKSTTTAGLHMCIR